MDFSSIIISIAIIIPGFITYNLSVLSIYRVKVSTFYITLYSILYSFIIWFLIFLVIKVSYFFNILFIYNLLLKNINSLYCILKNKPFDIDILFSLIIFFMILYIFSSIFGIIIAKLRLQFRKKYNKIYGTLFKRSQYEDTIDQIFETIIYESQNKNILFKTVSGEYFIGEVSIVSNNLHGKYIYFSKIQKYSKKKKLFLDIADNLGYCINTNFIEYMHIAPDENFDIDNLE